jgi:hypothetical protein
LSRKLKLKKIFFKISPFQKPLALISSGLNKRSSVYTAHWITYADIAYQCRAMTSESASDLCLGSGVFANILLGDCLLPDTFGTNVNERKKVLKKFKKFNYVRKIHKRTSLRYL